MLTCKSMIKDLPGSLEVKKFVIGKLSKNLSPDEFLDKNYSKRLSSQFASIKKQPFSERELTDFLNQLKRRSQAVSSFRDSAYNSRRTSVASAASEVPREEAPTPWTMEKLEATRIVRPAEQLAAPPPILTPGEERQGGDPLRLEQPRLPTAAPQVVEGQRLPQSPPLPAPRQSQPAPMQGSSSQSGLINIIGHGTHLEVHDNVNW